MPTITKTSLANLLDVPRGTIDQLGYKQLFIINYPSYRLYFSYSTCIAIERTVGNYIYITTERYSKTTTAHTNLLVKIAKTAKREVNFLDWFIFNDLYDSLAIHG